MKKAPERLRAARRFLPAALIVAAALLAYWPALRGGYIWDDEVLIVKNRDVRAEDGLLRVWFNRKSLEYLPLTYSMHWLEWRVFKGSATGPHVINVLLHGLSAALLGFVLQRLRVPGAWLAALLFALHPVAVASAAWLSERKNTLSMVLYLGSILAYLHFEDVPDRAGPQHDDTAKGQRHYFLSLGLFLLALLAKTSVVMLPVVLLLLAWWRRGKVAGRDLLRTVPFFALSLALGLVTVWFQWHNAIGQEVARPEGAASRVAAAGWIAWFYLYKILLPAGLYAIYPRWEVNGSSVLSFLPLVLLAGATALLWAGRKRWGPGPLVAWAYFMVSLLPVLGFVEMSFMHLSLVADHLQYAAMPGILAVAAAILARATAGGNWGRPAAVAVGICLAAMAALTFQRAGVFSSNQRLWRNNLEKSPRSASLWCNLGMAYVNAGAPDEAIPYFDKSLELDAKHYYAWLGRGIARAAAHRSAEAIGDYDQAIALKPDNVEAWYNRGNACFNTGRAEEALRDLDKAIALNPDFAEAYVNRGLIYAGAGRYAEAVRDYDQAIAVQADSAQAYVNRGLVFAATNRSAEAMRDYDEAIALKSDCVEAWYNRGTAYARAGRLDMALRDLDEAIALKPDYAMAYVNRGNVYMAAKRYTEATGDYGKAIACDPRYADAWYNRANAYLAANRPAEAVLDLDRLIELQPRDARAYYLRATARRLMKQDREALADLLMVRQLGGTVPEELLRSLGQPAPPPR
jgi:tetratricopeptide (TPR) repeat protein